MVTSSADGSLPDIAETSALADVPTDEDLLLSFRSSGSEAPFRQLVERYRAEVLRYLMNYLGDRQMAEDALQNTFFLVWRKAALFESGRRVRPWLFTIATNQAIDLMRRNRRHWGLVSLSRPLGDKGMDALSQFLPEELLGPVPDPSDASMSAEERDGVRRTITLLSPKHRRILDLVYFQRLKYREAADVLGIPLGSVKSRLHAAVTELGILLSGEAEDPAGAIHRFGEERMRREDCAPGPAENLPRVA